MSGGPAIALAGYLWLAGIAAGVFLVAALAVMFGDDDDRRTVRAAYRLAFPLACLCGVLVVAAGSGWNENQRWVPGTTGAWALGVFGVFSLAAFVDEWRSRRGRERVRSGRAGRIVALGDAMAAAALASRAGVTLGAADRPVWPDTTWIGPLLLASSVSMGVAALVPSPGGAARRLARLGIGSMALELAVLLLMAVALGPLAAPALLRWPGVLIPAAVVPLGIIAPGVLRRGSSRRGWRLAAMLAISGGLLLRAALVGTPGALLVGRF